MRTLRLLPFSRVILCASLIIFCGYARAQNAVTTPASTASAASGVVTPAQITAAIDPNNLVVLHGNVYPLARPEFDQGAVADAQPLHRMLLLLQRSAAQEVALRQLLADQQNKFSPDYHAWLTPEQFGAQFGPAAADVQTITSWLMAQGFHVNRVSAGRTLIEFDGTAGQVRSAFHTEIHRYLIGGVEHTANASDPEIPAALAPVVSGIVSLHNFPATSHLLGVGAFERSRKTGAVHALAAPSANSSVSRPLYTPPGGAGQNFPVVPADFATIYNVTPLWSSGIDGTGQTIAVVGDSNINVSDIQNFRALFGLSNNFTSANVTVDGVDPGVNSDEVEADLDVEWSGAVAKNATIQFVVAQNTEVSGGQDLAALYAVDHNLGGVLSESFGNCEQALGSAGNQYFNTLWEQAAAQGITAIASAGDGGSAGCDDFNTEMTATQGLAISGYASTPFNVAVGGTDFDQINKWTQFWGTMNDPVTLGSALGYIPEVPWNDSCAQLGLVGCGTSQIGGDLLNIVAGSGGTSTIYPKPSWQSGTGVPQDGKRDIPDVSLFASNGFTGSGYLICVADQGGYCQAGVQDFSYFLVGGTSASAPSFAGIMALINHSQQKQNLGSRQGIANNVLYALAKKQANVTPALNCNSSATPVVACTFNDVTSGDSFLTKTGVGNNSVPCTGGTLNCSATLKSDTGVLITTANTTPKVPAWTTTTGYDLASGLGSVNAMNLATNWKSANSTSTSTTLTLNSGSAVSITHGASVSVNVVVSPAAAVGQVALVAALPGGNSQSVGQFTLANGVATGSTSNLPGGTNYTVTAHYEGDGTNAPSDSTGVPVTVAPEPSKTFLSVPVFDPKTGNETGNTPSTLVYAMPYLVRADVTNSAGSLTQLCTSINALSCPTGGVTITDSYNGAPAQPLDAGNFALNSAGYTEDQTVQFSGGTHMLVAQYGGDNSYTKSASSPYALTITPAPTTAQVAEISGAVIAGQNFALLAILSTSALGGAVPTGTFTFYDGSTALPGTVTLSSIPGGSPELDGTLGSTVISTGGTHSITVKYSGDANYAATTSPALNLVVLYPTTANVTLSQQNIIFGASITATVTINTNVKSPAITGNIRFFASYDGDLSDSFTPTSGTDANGNTQLTATITLNPTTTETIFAGYYGDANFAEVNSQPVSVNVTTPDFSVAAPPPIVITAGQTGSGTLTFTPLSNLSSTVMLSCSGNLPVGSTCTFMPASVNLANSVAATAMISLSSIPPSPAAAAVVRAQRKSILGMGTGESHNPSWPLGVAAGLAALALLGLTLYRPRGHLTLATVLSAGLLCMVIFALGCGGGGSSFIEPPPPPQLAPTTTTISSTTPKVPQGTNAMVTATVTSSKTVTGTVTFFANGVGYASATLVNGVAQAQIPNFAPGTSAITAQYSGDANNQPSTSAAFNQVITGSTVFTVTAQTGVNVHQIGVTATIQ